MSWRAANWCDRPTHRVLVWMMTLVCSVSPGACVDHPSADHGRVERGARSEAVTVGVPWPWRERKDLLYGEGITLAVDEINGRGGVGGRKIQILRHDDAETVDRGRLVAEQLAANPDVVAVIGHLHSYVTGPAATIYDSSGLLMIAPTSTDPELTTQGYRRVFRTIFTDREVGSEMADFAADQAYSRVAIYYIRNQYGRALANAFEERANERGLTIVDRASYDPNGEIGSRSISDVLDEWKRRDLKAIFIAGEARTGARFIAEARRRGISAPIIGGDALGTSELFSHGAAAVEGTVVAAPFHPREPRAEAARFTQAFERRYHVPPDAAAALGYDAVSVLAQAMEAAGSIAPDQVANRLRSTKQWRGVTGTFTFGPNGDLVNRSIIKVVAKRGAFDYIADRSAAEGR